MASLDFDQARVQLIRARLQMTQQEFADHLGVSIDTVHSWEQAKTKPFRGALRGKLLAAEELAARRVAQAIEQEE